MRLACLYALADRSSLISIGHLRAALTVWNFCSDSARCLFGDRVGHPVADVILAALRKAWPESMTRTEISDLFKRNRQASEISEALELLERYRLAECERDPQENGRPVERWWERRQHEKNETTLAGHGDSSFISSISSPKNTADVSGII
jgi:hypothetical protein